MNNQDIPVISLNGFIARFKEQSNLRKNRPFCFILGAGASVSSEIPSGYDLATEWLATLYHEAVDPKPPVEEWATEASLGIKGFKYEDRASFYSQLYEKRFGKDPEGGYAFLEDAMSKKDPRVGYSILAYILTETQHKVVITTNFDNLVADALSIYTETFPLVLGDQSLARYASVDVRRPLIAKIHGALGFAMRNSSDEVGELPEEWITPLKQIFAKYTPIVIGYDGNDGGLMGLLKKMPKGSINSIYWCKRWKKDDASELLDKVKEPICDILRKHNGAIVPIPSFDQLMLKLHVRVYPDAPDRIEVLETKHRKRIRAYNEHFAELRKEDQEKDKPSTKADQSDEPRDEKSHHPTITEPDQPPTTIARDEPLSELDKDLIAFAQKQKVLPWWEWQRRVNQAPDSATKEKIFKQAIDQSPNESVLRNNYGVFLENEGRKDDALKLYKEAIDLDPKYAPALTSYGLLLSGKGNTDEAETYYKKAIEVDPKYAAALNNYGLLLSEKGNIEEAETYYKKAIKADPKNAVALNNYANLLSGKGNTDEAETYYKKAIEADPKYAKALNNYAILLSQKGNSEEAETYYKRAIKADPKHAPALNNYGALLEEKGDTDEAETYYKKAIEADPKNATALNNYGALLGKKGDTDEAETFYKKAIDADPKYATALNNYGALLDKKGNIDGAETFYKKAIDADPKYAVALTNYGFLFEEKGNIEEAEAYYKKAIEADPKYALALSNYALLLNKKGNTDEAETYSKRAIEADPIDANPKADLAHLYFQQKKLGPAFELLSEAEALAPKEKPLQVEMLFYRLAYDKKAWPVRLKEMRDLFAAGARSPNWPLDKHIENAKGLEHPNVELLQEIANVASKGEPMSSLEEFAEWPKSKK
jgi:tetratricopeptide (TPR) repeat protein